jgi:hypothetical protein
MWLLFLAIGGIFAIAAKTKPTAYVVSGISGEVLPWSPPIATSSPRIFKGMTSKTVFPVDVYNWAVPNTKQMYVLVFDSRNQTSFVAYSIVRTARRPQTVMIAKGSGPRTQQIIASI